MPHHAVQSLGASTTGPARVVTVNKTPSGSASTAPAAASTTLFAPTNSITRGDEVTYNGLDVAPPDTQIAAGPAATVEVVNDMGTITPRNASPIQTKFDLNTFFNVPVGFLFTDPKIVYDSAAGRWYLSGFSLNLNFDSHVYLAVSQTSDPAAGWWAYGILDQTGVACDQPHLGFSSDNIVVTCDNFTKTTVVPDPGYMMIGKAGAITGYAYEYMRFFGPNDGGTHNSLQPAYSMTPTTTEYLLYYNGFGVGVLAVYGNVANRSVGWGESLDQLPVTGLSIPPPAAQGGTTNKLDTGDMRILSVVFRSNVIWLSSGDSCIPTGDTVQHACARLIQLDVSNFPHPTKTQDYNFAQFMPGPGTGQGVDIYYPAITMDASGTTYLAFSSSTASGFPEFDIADILPATPGQVDQVFQIVGGSGFYTGPSSPPGGPMRWGDYSGAAPDPTDAHGVILAGEYATAGSANNWGTEGGLFRIGPCNSANLTYQPQSPVYPGPSITFMASSAGCWGTPQYRFWKRPPGGTWSIAQDYGAATNFVWDTSKETVLGTYNFEVDVRSQGFITAYDTTYLTSFTLASPPTCSDTVTFNPASPAGTGSSVLISASSSCPDPIYRFWIMPPGGPWSVVQGYGPASTFNWTANGAAGVYNVEVDVKARLEAASFYGFPTNLTYTLQACSGAALSANPASPSMPGGTIQLTGSATCLGTPTYRFWVRPPGGAWAIKQDWSTTSTFSWLTAGLGQGSYSLELDVRNQGAAAGYESVAGISYLLSTGQCAPGLSANPASGATGTAVTFTATSIGCPNPRFRFWLQPPGGAWRIAQDYSPITTFAWGGSGAPGLYHVEVDARDASETVAYDAVATMTYAVNPCSSAGISATPASPQLPGGTIAVTGTSTCPGTPTYRFWLDPPGGSWTIRQDFSTNATFNWPTAGLPTGTYLLEVDVRDQGATSSYEVTSGTAYTLGQPCSKPTLTANPTSPGPSGGAVTLTATTTVCPNPQYRFWLKPPGGAWYTAGYITLNTYTVSGIPGGLASFEVDVKDASESVAYDAVTNITYQFDPCNSATLTANAMIAPQGPVVNLVGGATCPNGGMPEFRFWIRAPGGSWMMVEDYPAGTNNYQWSTTGLPRGTYYLEVDVRNKGTNVGYETVTVLVYQLT